MAFIQGQTNHFVLRRTDGTDEAVSLLEYSA